MRIQNCWGVGEDGCHFRLHTDVSLITPSPILAPIKRDVFWCKQPVPKILLKKKKFKSIRKGMKFNTGFSPIKTVIFFYNIFQVELKKGGELPALLSNSGGNEGMPKEWGYSGNSFANMGEGAQEILLAKNITSRRCRHFGQIN